MGSFTLSILTLAIWAWLMLVFGTASGPRR